MKRRPVNLVMFLLFLAVGTSLAVSGPEVPFSVQWPLYEALRTTAAIIFAVIGAWVAIAFPERLRLLSGPKPNDSGAGNRRFLDLFAPVIHSTAILCIVLLVGLAAPVVKGLVADPATVGFLRRASFGQLTVLTLWQVWTVLLTLIPADELKSAMDRDIAMHRSRDALRGLGSEMKPPKDDEL